MKNTHPECETRATTARASLVRVVTPDLIVSSGVEQLDRLLGGFKAGELTLVDGNSGLISDLPHQLCVNTYRTFQSETIYIDGGMCANPYQIARYARMLEMNQQDVLQNVVMSRAFTVYQLSTIIQELLEPMTLKRRPRTLIIGMLPALYLDPEISPREAQMLLSQDLEKLQELTTRYHLITVCTNRDAMPLASSNGLGKTLYDRVSEIVRMKQFEQYTALELVKQGTHATIVHNATGQLRLEEFGMVT
jgi:RecA/RadA recombinase